MPRVLITGMSGVGKSTLLAELARRGHRTIDTDYDGWTLPDGLWDPMRIEALLSAEDDLVISGTVSNQVDYYDYFDHIVLLSIPLEEIFSRITRRTNNPYGKSLEQQSEIREFVESVEPLLRVRATIELDGLLPTTTLADQIEGLIRSRPRER